MTIDAADQLLTITTGGYAKRFGGDIERRFTCGGPLPIHSLQGPMNNGQGAQAQKIEFDQPGGLHIVLIELGNTVSSVGITHYS